MSRTETPWISVEDAADLEHFTAKNARVMRDRLDHGAKKFGALSWRTETYTDDQNVRRLYRALMHLETALVQYRIGSVDEDEVRKRAADVANQAFMLADPSRETGEPR